MDCLVYSHPQLRKLCLMQVRWERARSRECFMVMHPGSLYWHRYRLASSSCTVRPLPPQCSFPIHRSRARCASPGAGPALPSQRCEATPSVAAIGKPSRLTQSLVGCQSCRGAATNTSAPREQADLAPFGGEEGAGLFQLKMRPPVQSAPWSAVSSCYLWARSFLCVQAMIAH